MRGRPTGSSIRNNIIEILYFTGKGYGYDIYRAYIELFPRVSMRSIYYHLKKGVKLDEFKVEKVSVEKGTYSWGPEAEKTYYELGPNAKPVMNKMVRDFFERKKQGVRDNAQI